MWEFLKGFILFLVVNRTLVRCDYFSVVGAKTLRIDQPYEVAVTNHGLSNETKEILVSVEGTSFIGKKYKATENVEVGPFETKVVEIEVNFLRW